jgi:hypothetical protein
VGSKLGSETCGSGFGFLRHVNVTRNSPSDSPILSEAVVDNIRRKVEKSEWSKLFVHDIPGVALSLHILDLLPIRSILAAKVFHQYENDPDPIKHVPESDI